MPAVSSQTDELSVTQHLVYGVKSHSKFAIALPWFLLRSIPTTPSSTLLTATLQIRPQRLTTHVLQVQVLFVLHYNVYKNIWYCYCVWRLYCWHRWDCYSNNICLHITLCHSRRCWHLIDKKEWWYGWDVYFENLSVFWRDWVTGKASDL